MKTDRNDQLNKETYTAESTDTIRQKIDINRLRTQSLIQNNQTRDFLNLPRGTHLDVLAIPFCGGGEALDVYLPFLDEKSEVILIDISQDKVDAAEAFAIEAGFKGKITKISKPAIEAFEILKSSGVKIDLVDLKLALIWDPEWQKTLSELYTIIKPGGLVIIQDMNPSTMWTEPHSDNLDILVRGLIEFRQKRGLENNINSLITPVSKAIGFEVEGTGSYQTITLEGHDNHYDVWNFLDGAKIPITNLGKVSEEVFDRCLKDYKSELKKSRMAYPEMNQYKLRMPEQ